MIAGAKNQHRLFMTICLSYVATSYHLCTVLHTKGLTIVCSADFRIKLLVLLEAFVLCLYGSLIY